MPKIRQAIAVFVAAAFCIGFNTFRYPVVWEMVVAVPQPAKPADSSHAGAIDPSRNEVDRINSSGELAEKNHAANCKDGVCTIGSPNSTPASIYGSVPNEPQSEPKSTLNPSFEPESKTEPSGLESQATPTQRESRSKDVESEFPSKPFEPQPGSTETGRAPEGTEEQQKGTEPATADTSSSFLGSYGDQKTERKPSATLVSDPSTAKYFPEKAEDLPLGGEPLVPIERPRSPGKEATGFAGHRGFETRTDSTASPGSDAQKARHLPEVDRASSPDFSDPSANVTPELMRTYRVTPAK